MNNRPFFRSTIDQLESLFGEARDIESFEKLKTELQFRTTPRATILLRKVDVEIRALVAKTQPLDRTREENGGATGSTALQDSNRAQGIPATIQVPVLGFPISENKNDRKSFEIEAETIPSDKAPPDNHSRLLDLLEYLEHLAKLDEKPVFALREYQQLVFSEAELKGQIGITHDVSTDEEQVWLRIERLQRADPPQPPQEIRDWIVAQPSAKSAIANYVSAKWGPWAEAEKPRRSTIAIYDKFFSLYQSLQAEGVERPLEIVWGIGVARWKVRNQEIDHPLIEQLVEIDVHIDSGVITIGPRSAMPQPALKPYFSLEVDGVDATLDFVKHFFEAMPADLEFSPFQRSTFEPVLRFAATHLDSSGRYHPDGLEDINDRTLPAITGSLVITDTWAIYARPRSVNFFIEDLDRLRKAVTNSVDLPGPCKKLVEPPSSERTYSPTLIDVTKATLGGPPSESVSVTSTEASNESDQEFFFPKAFNADQVAIVQRLVSKAPRVRARPTPSRTLFVTVLPLGVRF